MIKFINLSPKKPFQIFKKFYDKANKKKQDNIEAVCISSYSHSNRSVNSRFVNLKIINNEEFIFFTNYNSPKAKEFQEHDQISAVFFWSTINTQIRFKASIAKIPNEFNEKYFKNRSETKNALAIASSQSSKIQSYEEVKKKYSDTLKNEDLKKCPSYWGGFSFKPYYFEFWEGHESRINRRRVFKFTNDNWINYILEP